MKLVELNAKLFDAVPGSYRILTFDCPCGKCGGRIRCYLGDQQVWHGGKCVWKATGTFPNLTLEPSINAQCWHGFIRNGEVTSAN